MSVENSLLSGIRVLDLSRLLPGPFCTLYLAQLGAEVIKIEEPDGGDYARTMPELFAQLNRGKKSVTLDLREAGARATFLRMVDEADVVIESFRPGVMDKLGCGWDQLRQRNPRLVYAALTGYGQTGPYKDRAGHDMNYCAYAGVLDQLGRAGGPPVLSNLQIADLAGGSLTCAIGILAAVIGARQTGKGAFVDVGMLDGALTLQTLALATLRQHGSSLPRGADMLTGALPNYRIYRCRDGKYLAVAALEPKFALKMLQVIGGSLPRPLRALGGLLQRRRKPRSGTPRATAEKPKPKQDQELGRWAQRLDNPARLRRLLLPVHGLAALLFLSKRRDQWEALLAGEDACVCAVLTLDETLQNEQVRARGLVESVGGKPAFLNPIRFLGAQTHSGAVPALGADTEAVLAALRPLAREAA